MDSASATSTDGCSVNVENAGTIAGKIFVDANCNRELDANEVYIEDPSGPPTCPYQQVQDGFSVSYSSIAKTGSTIPNECDANGPFYFAIVPPSTYTINLNMPAGWQNTTRTSVTEVLNTGGSLLKTFGVRQCTPLSFNPLTSFVSNLRPDPGEHYLAYCDYGVRTDSIVIADPNCVWTGYPHTDNNGWLGTAKEFNCTAPFARGTYDVVCTVEICTPSNNCARSDKAGSIIVAPGCGNGVVDPGEECDDGNLVGDDLCRNDCKLNVLVSKSVIVDFNGMSNVSDPLWVQAKKVAYPSGPQASGWIAQNLDPEITEYEDYPQILTATGWNRLLMDYHIFNSNSFGFMLPNNATYNVTFIAGGRLSGKTHTGMVHVKIQDSNGVSGQTDLDTVPDGKIKYFTVSDVALQDYAVFNLTKYDPSDVAVITGIILQCTETSPPLPDFDNNCDKNYIISGVNITGISVSPNPSGRAATVNISCGSSVADVDCIDAYLDSGMCTFDSWHGDNANFTCLASTTCPARQIAKCSVNETKCKRGSTNNMSSLLNVICGPCGYIDQATCETDNACSWNPMCQGTKYLSSADPDGICVTKRTSTYSCKAGKCGAECDPATSCPDFRISIETSGRKCYYGTGICNGNCGCDYSSSCILNVNERCDRNMGCVIDNSLNLSMHVNVTAVPKRPSLGETVNVSVKGKILDINGSRVTVVAKCGQSQTLDLVPCTMAELMFDKGLEGREVNLLTSHKPPGQFIQPQPYNVASPENFDTSGKQWIIYLGSFDYRNSNVSACLGYQGITGCGNDTYNVQSVGMNIDVKYPDVEGQIIPVTATGAPNFTRGMKINFIVNARTTNIGLGYDCNSNAACDVTYNISDGSGEPFYSTPAFWDGFIKGYRGQEPSTGLDCNRYYKLNVRAYVKDGPYKDTEGTESFDIYMSCAPAVTVSPAEARTYLGQANTKVFDVTFWNPLTTPMNDLQLRMDSEDAQEYPVNWLHFDSGGVNLGKIIDHFSVSGLSSRTYSVVLEEAGRSGKYTAVFTVSDNPQQVIVAKNSGRLYIFAEGLPEFAFWQLLVAFVIAGAIIFIKKDYAAGARKSAGRVVNKVAL
jgi:cysteine-rich repeat protein